MYAIIATGGKQYKVAEGDVIRVEKLGVEVTGDVRGKNILVIDDVYTTGSTIDAMAGCLKRKGAGNVYFLTVCIGRR